MKKFIALGLAMIMTVLLTGCSNSNQKTAEKATETVIVSKQAYP